ncbi:MAG: DNA polymerase III subunit alpha, partial [Verrucomicrobia bacterium]|nr:DNA polymerase III subunit alpha [Verrucomicrobiota bacterium]
YELLGFYLREHPLDEFKDRFAEYSCCPLSDFPKLDKTAVCRTAFIIETVAVKVSAKTQKKFAILTISDGIEHYELPIWSELYEQNHALLVETKLIYAVLQVERQQEEVKLQCRWLTDLTTVDDKVLKICDEMYEKGKAMQQLAELKEKRMNNAVAKAPSTKEGEKMETVEIKVPMVKICIDVHKAKLSHVLEIKKIFRENAGDSPITIDFMEEKRKLGSLRIAKEWGVKWSQKIESLLQPVGSITSIRIER